MWYLCEMQYSHVRLGGHRDSLMTGGVIVNVDDSDIQDGFFRFECRWCRR